MRNITKFKGGWMDALSYTLWFAKRTPLIFWAGLPVKISWRVDSLIGQTDDPDRIYGLLAGKIFAIHCVENWCGIKAVGVLTDALYLI